MEKKKWCEICKFLTYTCKHNPDQSDAARELEPGIIMLPEGAKRVVTKRETFLAFNSDVAIPGCTSALVEASPQIIFRPHRLVVDPLIAPDFRLLGIRCGNMYQGASTINVSCAIFGPHPDPEKFEPVKNLGQCDTCVPGTSIFLHLYNRNPSHRDFDAIMYGDGVW